jgi:NTE family protein
VRASNQERLRALLARMPLFAELGVEMREAVLANARLLHLHGGERLFSQGDEGDALYVIASGRVEVVREAPAPAVVLRRLGRGESIGELALLTGGPRSASARAVRDSELLVIHREQMLALLHDSPPFAIALTRALGRLLQRGEPPPGRPPPPSVLAIVPLHPGAPIGAVCDALLGQLQQLARVVVLRRGEPPGPDSDESLRAYGRRLDELERSHDHVLLVGADDDADPDWNAYCGRQADRVVAVAGPVPAPTLAVPALGPEHVDLLLWGPRERTTRLVAGWLDAVRPQTHHYVEPSSQLAATAARTARRLVGRATGLVLSGGGAGGLAHLGVLEVLVGGAVTLDRIGGCSFGALVGALFAMGRSPQEIAAICRRELVERNPFNDYAVPVYALLRGQKAERALRDVFGQVQIEQLPLDFFCVSADLERAELVVHRRGRLADAILASMSLPGVRPPVRAGGRLLVDGGFLNNLPVDVMAGRDEGPVIAVDVLRRRMGPDDEAPLGRPRAGGRRRLRDLPTIQETLSRAATLGNWAVTERNRARAQLVIAPDVRGIGILEFRRLEEIAAAGRRAAAGALEAARAVAAVSPR